MIGNTRLDLASDRAGSINLRFMKFAGRILGTPSEKNITIINTRQNESTDESFENILTGWKRLKKKAGHVVESHWTVLRLLEKRLYRKLMQILNDATHPMKHYFNSRRSNKSGRFLLPRTNTNRYKASFLPSVLSF